MNQKEHDELLAKIFEENKETLEKLEVDFANCERSHVSLCKSVYMDDSFLNIYFDRMGNPISVAKWAVLNEILYYKVIKQEDIGDFWVSTVWLGINHDFFNQGPPIIFETMIFPKKGKEIDYDDRYMDRYCTEEDAIAGHAKALEIAKTGKINNEV